MTYNLSDAVFTNDFYSISLDNGSFIVFNLVDEQPKVEEEEVSINNINIAVVDAEGNQVVVSNVIGMDTPYFNLTSAYSEVGFRCLREATNQEKFRQEAGTQNRAQHLLKPQGGS